jgi:two-component system nitrate/nitrite response regulator NarL
MRIVICDDQRLLLEALSSAFAARGHTVEALTTTPHDAVAAVWLHDPDVLVLDLSFPEADGLDAARELVHHHARTKVVVLTGTDDLGSLRRALEIGVAGYVRKDQRIDHIVAVLERVHRGEHAIDETLTRRLARAGAVVPRPRFQVDDLTAREWDVANLLEHGLSTTEIMTCLGISKSTVRSHIHTILSKLHAHSRVQAVAMLASGSGHRGVDRGELGEHV